jgi:hypothetical protein
MPACSNILPPYPSEERLKAWVARGLKDPPLANYCLLPAHALVSFPGLPLGGGMFLCMTCLAELERAFKDGRSKPIVRLLE